MTRIATKDQFDPHPPYLRMICPSCGRPLPQTPRCVWGLCVCTRVPLTPSDLGSSSKPTSERELECQPWRKASDR
jgi:hypothetical protein